MRKRQPHTGGWIRTAAEPTATTTSAASGGSSEELLGPRPAIRKQGAADAGCRNPSACGGNREARLGQRSVFSKPRQGAAEKSANAARCCCLACGSQSIGMSIRGVLILYRFLFVRGRGLEQHYLLYKRKRDEF